MDPQIPPLDFSSKDKEIDTIPGFDQLGLRPDLVEGLAKAGFHKPTPIQSGVIPPAILGRDVLGKAQTGTGKTGAFLIPFFHRFAEFPATSEPFGIVLAPTRELVVQVQEQN